MNLGLYYEMKKKIVCYPIWPQVRVWSILYIIENMIACVLGLGSILFAISIDKPELNSGITHKADTFKTKAEPIIEAPIPGMF